MVRSPAALVLALATLVVPAAAQSEEWPQWRGPNRDGISTEGLSPEGKTDPLWQAKVGTGYSSVVIKNGLLYTIGHDEEKQEDTVFCFDAKNGKQIWSHTYRCKTMAIAHKGGSLTTPSIDGDRVWVVNREGILHVYDAKQGSVRLQRNLRKNYGAKPPKWGFSASPLVLDDMIVLNVGRVVAVDRNGKTLWKTKKDYGAGYSTPVTITLDGRECLLVLNADGLILLDRKRGKHLARFAFKTSFDVNAATPVVIGERVFVSAGYRHGCAMVRASTKGFELLWESKVMRNHMAGCTHFEQHLYGFDESRFKCIDLDGNEKWNERFGKAAHVIADGKLVVLTSRGDLVIGEANPAGFTPLSRKSVLEGGVYWTTPVVVGGLVYCRNSLGDLACIDHRK